MMDKIKKVEDIAEEKEENAEKIRKVWEEANKESREYFEKKGKKMSTKKWIALLRKKKKAAGLPDMRESEFYKDTMGDWRENERELKLSVDEEKLLRNIYLLLLDKRKDEATEVIVQDILDRERIFTTRDDERSEMWIYKEGIYVPQGRTYIQERCRGVLGITHTTQMTNRVITKIEADTFIDQNEFFDVKYDDLIAVENGILNVKTKELKEFDPEFRFFNKIPVYYEEKADCKNIYEFLRQILKSEKEVKVLEELFGFLLYDDYFLEKGVMFYGDGRNGKGKLLSLMKAFLGMDNCVEVSLEHLEEDMYAVGELFKMKANLCGDLSRTALKNSGNFKKLVGRDMVAAPRKFKTRVKFVNTAKMVFSANELPITYDITEAFWNRWIIIDFPNKFLPKDDFEGSKDKNTRLQNPDILERITTEKELSGLLNVALNGLKRILKNGTFSKSQSAEEIKKMWIRRSDSCLSFITDYVVEDFEDGFITKEDFRRKYAIFCSKHKLKHATDKKIKGILNIHLGAMDTRLSIDGNQVHCWVGIKFNSNIDDLVIFSQGSQHSHINTTPIENARNDIGVKTPSNLTTLTNHLANDDDKKVVDKGKDTTTAEDVLNYIKDTNPNSAEILAYFKENRLEVNDLVVELSRNGDIYEKDGKWNVKQRPKDI